MADITNEIAAIQVATTGAAIRAALVDALEAINTDQSWTADDVPTEDSDNLVKSGGIYSAIQAIKKKVIISSISLSISWSGSDPYSQEITIAEGTASSKIDIQPDATILQQFLTDGVLAMWVENNNGTFTAYTIGAHPSTNLTIQCTITETT